MKNQTHFALLGLLGFLFGAISLLFTVLPQVHAANAAPSEQTVNVINGAPFAYQGMLRDSSGKLLTGTYNLTFAIYDQPTGGTILHKETILSVAVRDGDFTTLLGADPFTPFSPTVFATQPRYIGIAVQPDPEMSPRQEVHAVPWALIANQALTVADASVTTAKLADNSITSTKVSDGGINTDDLANGAVTAAKLAADVTKITMLSEPITVEAVTLPTPVSTVWHSLSLAQIIPASTKAVLLNIAVQPTPGNGPPVSLLTRKPGSIVESQHVESVLGWDHSQGWVNVSNQSIEYLLDGYGNANFFIAVVGYME